MGPANAADTWVPSKLVSRDNGHVAMWRRALNLPAAGGKISVKEGKNAQGNGLPSLLGRERQDDWTGKLYPMIALRRASKEGL
jgi:hypothetical protein